MDVDKSIDYMQQIFRGKALKKYKKCFERIQIVGEGDSWKSVDSGSNKGYYYETVLDLSKD